MSVLTVLFHGSWCVPSYVIHIKAHSNKGGLAAERDRAYIIALLTSLVGITPSFSPSMGSEKRANASLISASSCAVMSCSLASLDGRGPPPPFAPLLLGSAAAFRFAGYGIHFVSRLKPE